MECQYPNLLKPVKAGKFILKNRLQSSNSMPHFSMGPEEYPADPIIAHFMGRSRGAAFVTLCGVDDNLDNGFIPDSMDFSHFPDFDMYNPKCQNYMTELVDAMHAQNTLVSGSLFSANKKFRYINENGEHEFINACINKQFQMQMADGPDAIIDDSLDKEIIRKIIKSYGQRTALYKKLGFDAVTIHMSYRAQLPSQFLSPICNKRTDEYGGDLEGRARFALEMLEEVRKAAGSDMLIEIQFSAKEPKGGYDIDEGIEFLRMAEKYLDIVQVRSAGGDENHPIPFELRKTPFLNLAARIKAEGFDFLVSNVGGYFDPALSDAAIREGKVDLVAMARAWISNPDYTELISSGRADDLVPCLRCNKCHGRGKDDVFVTTCSVNPLFGFEKVSPYMERPTGQKKKIAIIGGGPGGMRSAIYLADRGHNVTIYEASEELGGAIRHSDYVPFKWTLKDYKDYLIAQVNKRKNITVKLSTLLRAGDKEIHGKYDVIIAAIGAEPVIPNIPGAVGSNVTIATHALMHSEEIGKNAVIIGGGEVGVETGMFLAQSGRNVTVLEMRDILAADSTWIHYRDMMKEEWEKIGTFHSVVNATAKEITADHVTYTDKDGTDHEIPSDSVILSVGMRAKTDDALAFYDDAPAFYMIGDCKRPGTIQTTNRNAYGVCMNI